VRASILSTEKFRGVRLGFESGLLKVQAHNPEREQSDEEVPIEYDGDEISVGFNVSYLLDVLNANAHTGNMRLAIENAESSCLITAEDVPAGEKSLFVVMPIRL